MVFPLVDVPKISLLQCDFQLEMLSQHGSPNGHEDEVCSIGHGADSGN